MDQNTTPPAGTLEPGLEVSVLVERMGALGRGVTRVNGKALLVRRGLPGERVRARVERVYPKYALASVVAVESPVRERVEPACPHFQDCGGCDWQHVEPSAQAAFKQAVLTEQLERIGGLKPPPFAVEQGPPLLGYRDKLEFVAMTREGR